MNWFTSSWIIRVSFHKVWNVGLLSVLPSIEWLIFLNSSSEALFSFSTQINNLYLTQDWFPEETRWIRMIDSERAVSDCVNFQIHFSAKFEIEFGRWEYWTKWMKWMKCQPPSIWPGRDFQELSCISISQPGLMLIYWVLGRESPPFAKPNSAQNPAATLLSRESQSEDYDETVPLTRSEQPFRSNCGISDLMHLSRTTIHKCMTHSLQFRSCYLRWSPLSVIFTRVKSGWAIESLDYPRRWGSHGWVVDGWQKVIRGILKRLSRCSWGRITD
jgi:hypothetical protein